MSMQLYNKGNQPNRTPIVKLKKLETAPSPHFIHDSLWTLKGVWLHKTEPVVRSCIRLHFTEMWRIFKGTAYTQMDVTMAAGSCDTIR